MPADEPAPAAAGGGLVRLRLDISYDGTAFSGWARQPGRRTVEGTLQAALTTVFRETVNLTVAGRTDAGVHATGQVAHTDVPAGAWAELGPSLLRRLAGVLPRDLRVRAIAVAPDGFHARFSALARNYTYRLSDADWGVEPLRRQDTVPCPRPLDVDRMRTASAALLGEHDFAAYCRRRERATTIRTLLALDWHRVDGLVRAEVAADAFCHSMVRSLVGALLDVGFGLRPTAWPAEVLAAGVREPRVNVAPARGLTLAEVRYPPAPAMAERAAATRRRRTAEG